MWISKDEINVSAEEDVLTLILTWIDSERSERKKHFAELFREVRLAFISRDYLLSDVVTNDLVNVNEGYMDLVKAALKSIDTKNYHHVHAKPRKSLATPAIVFLVVGHEQEDQPLACYYPREGVWSQFCAPVRSYCVGKVTGFHGEVSWSRFNLPNLTRCGDGKVISCHGELYFICDSKFHEYDGPLPWLRYDAFSECWESIPYMYAEQRTIRKAFVSDEEKIYVLSVSKLNGRECWREYECAEVGHGEHVYFITKYKPESNSWEDIVSFDMGSRVKMFVVAKGNFIYFLGGLARSGNESKTLAHADRYDLSRDTWDK